MFVSKIIPTHVAEPREKMSFSGKLDENNKKVDFECAKDRDRIFAGESLFGAAIWCGSRDVVHPGQEKEATAGV